MLRSFLEGGKEKAVRLRERCGTRPLFRQLRARQWEGTLRKNMTPWRCWDFSCSNLLRNHCTASLCSILELCPRAACRLCVTSSPPKYGLDTFPCLSKSRAPKRSCPCTCSPPCKSSPTWPSAQWCVYVRASTGVRTATCCLLQQFRQCALLHASIPFVCHHMFLPKQPLNCRCEAQGVCCWLARTREGCSSSTPLTQTIPCLATMHSRQPLTGTQEDPPAWESMAE